MRVLFALLTVVLLAGCQSSPSSSFPSKPLGRQEYREADVRSTVERYNVLLAAAYRELNANPLQEVASRDQAEKVYLHMAALGEGTVRMLSQVKEVQFAEVALLPAAQARAKTVETWDFAFTDIKTGAKREERKNFVYQVEYRLAFANNHWTITDITAHSDQPEKK